MINTKALALTLGILWSLSLLAVSLIALVSTDYLHNITDFFSTLYLGYDLSFTGIMTGMVWAFIDAAIGGLVVAWLYNKLNK